MAPGRFASGADDEGSTNMPGRAATLSIAAVALASATTSAAQLGASCPLALTPAQALEARANLEAGLYDAPPIASLGTTVIPIVAHVVRRSDGTGGLSQVDLDQSFLDAQAHFTPGGFELCVADVLFIDDDGFYSGIDSMAELDTLRSTNPVQGAINIYFTEELSSGGSTICGMSSFTFSSVQGIVVRNACTAAGSNTSTLAHEIGHYFDLFHTHENALGTECVDGSNCTTNGDQLCDTPADPNVLGEVDTSCTWFGSASDPCGSGLPFDPPVFNLMSYSTTACRQQFTPQQLGRVLATLTNLRTDLDPALCEPACDSPADANADGELTPADFNAWILAFNTNDPIADQNADGLINPSDFNAWILNYNAGCP